jgi:cysteine desulfuration protein SufE
MSNTQQQQANELIEAFGMFDDWEDRYSFLIDLGRELPPMDEADKTEANRVQGCQSRVWIVAHACPTDDGGKVITFVADSDSAIVKGLIAILHRVYSGQTAEKILAFDIEGLLKTLELQEHLSMNRRNGLFSMIQYIKTQAASTEGMREEP